MGLLALLGAVPVLGAGCLGAASPPPLRDSGPAATTLRITVKALGLNGHDRLLRTWTLGCAPPAGTSPDPRAACTALRDYVAHYRAPTSACGCGALALGVRYAVISGTLDGRRITARFAPCMCGFAERLTRDLRIATGLRSFAPVPGA